MSEAFVWFQNSSDNPTESGRFYEKLLGWRPADGPPGMTLYAGANGPFAAIGAREGTAAGWVPYAQADGVDAATKKALKLGAVVLREKTRGPAGHFVVVRDPGGAAVALWQKA